MVSIIILSYNTKDLLLSCLSSLEKYLSKSDYEIIIVDNASSDDSVAMVNKAYPQVTLIQNKTNTGFATGANIGATKAKGEYLLFLNSDTQITKNILPEVLSLFSVSVKTGALGLRMENKGGYTEKSYGEFYSFTSLFSLLFLPQRSSAVNDTIEVDWVSGGCFFIRREVFEKLHGFDEKLFMYVEDLEICYRIKKLGYTILYVPAVPVTHLGQGSSNRTFAIVHIYKGIMHFYRKHKRGGLWYAKMLLRMKAWVSISIGSLTKNTYLVSTYKKALQTL